MPIMAGTFSTQVASGEWLAQAHEWITSELDQVGRTVTGEVVQTRIRPWSTQLVVPTDLGTVWFKANCPDLAFEPALHGALARLVPDEVDRPLAVDPGRGWMMTADRGVTLGDHHTPTLADWQDVVALAANLQRRVAGHGDELGAAGLPDCSPGTIPGRYDRLVAELSALPPTHPSHLAADAADELRAGRGVVEGAVARLLTAPLPPTLQHGDLHPKNVFVVDAGLRVFDFGDAQWAHPLEVLAVPWGWVTQLTTLPWEPVLDAYAAGWGDLVGRAELEELMSAALVTHAVNRSQTWLGAVAGATGQELQEWGDAPLYYLRLALEPFPRTDQG